MSKKHEKHRFEREFQIKRTLKRKVYIPFVIPKIILLDTVLMKRNTIFKAVDRTFMLIRVELVLPPQN